MEVEATDNEFTDDNQAPAANDNSHESSSNRDSPGPKDGSKRQQFTLKQRMDMYAFCVLELEMHSNKVSIKKQQLALQKVLASRPKQEQQETVQALPIANGSASDGSTPPISSTSKQDVVPNGTNSGSLGPAVKEEGTNGLETAPQTDDATTADNDGCKLSKRKLNEKTLMELQREVEQNLHCYSDYQKTQVLTSSMLRDVQARFSRYYPNAAIPSRTTIKHVFEKCVAHGTVENIKRGRRPTKLADGDEIETLLVNEPQLSLRQMARKLNVSTGTVSRRCKEMGLVPESVTIKHQQMISAKRHRKTKQSKLNNNPSKNQAQTGRRQPKQR